MEITRERTYTNGGYSRSVDEKRRRTKMFRGNGKGEIGIVGLGKMCSNIATRLLGKGYRVVVHNRSDGPADRLKRIGAIKSGTVSDLVLAMDSPRTIWVMLPPGEVTIKIVGEIAMHCTNGDTIIDGSNSYYKDSICLYKSLLGMGIDYMDAGCSGGPSGALNGMSIMLGGKIEAFKRNEKLFRDLSVKGGYMYVGEAGAGHFAKMVHNAIEYGMMQSIAEGMELATRGPYKSINPGMLAKLWNNGSVIRGYLIGIAASILLEDPKLSGTSSYVDDTGYGRQAVKEAVDFGVPLSAIAESLFYRFDSQDKKRFGKRLLAALRHGFGGHEIRKR
jgi:6-phosphogluconate dehydrogenase